MSSLASDSGVFGVTETWLRPGTPSHLFNIPGYSMVRWARQTGEHEKERVGGGVALYIN